MTTASTQTDTDPRAESLARVGLPASALPRHIAIIMDGNGRWARAQGKSRIHGHECGARNVRAIVTECARLGLEALTLYSFSTENWTRPAHEIDHLMRLYVQYLQLERPTLLDNNVRLVQIGRRAGLSAEVLEQLDQSVALTAANTGLKLVLAINYGSRAEITDAVRSIAARVRRGEIDPDAIDETTIAGHLYTAGLPDPDLLIRTAGEMRLSNYLLWQISYAELFVTEACWPEFDLSHLDAALRSYAARNRKFGTVDDPGD